jgi:hypothetical protein
MPGERWTQSPDEWQQLILKLLKIRYPIGEFVEVPDTVHGDCGIEGYGLRDGKAFQCYAPEGEPLATAELTKRQKAKITKDLDKLKSNAATLQSLLGTTKLHSWILVVPRWEDKALQAHAEAKAAEVREAGLPFIASDFAPSIVTGEDFLVERGRLVSAGADSLRIESQELDDHVREDWVDTNDQLMANLDRKALAICQGRITDARKLRDDLVRRYLEGQNALEKLASLYPDLYEVAFRVKEDREHFLETESLIPDLLPPQKMKETLDSLRAEFATALPGLSRFTVNQLVHEAVSDWLLRCPLDFPQPITHDGHTTEPT